MEYPIVLIPIITGCITQSAKFLLSIIRHRKIELKYLTTSGHMPSAHTAFVVSLITTVGYFSGINSSIFAVSFVLAFIVIHDALRIRINIGHNGRIINQLVGEIPGIKKENYPTLKERVGHRPEEVLLGGFLGFIITIFLLIIF